MLFRPILVGAKEINPLRFLLLASLTILISWNGALFGQVEDVPFPVGPRPIIHFEQLEHDWGKVLQGSLVKHVFQVENRGQTALKILKVSSTCGCTSTRFDEVIEPGSSGIIELQVDTVDFSGGRPRKNAVVKTNDPANSEINLWMVGLVDPLLKLESPVLKLSGLALENKQLVTLILPAVDLPIEMLEAKSKNGVFLVSVLEEQENGWQLTLEADESDQIKSLRDDLQLTVSVEGGPPLVIPVPVVVEHKDRITISPSGNLVFYRRHTAPLDGPVKREVKKEVQVRSVRDDLPMENFSAEIIDAPEGLFKMTVSELIPGHHYKIVIQVLKTMPTSQVQSTLRMTIGPGIDNVREKGVIAQFRLRNAD